MTPSAIFAVLWTTDAMPNFVDPCNFAKRVVTLVDSICPSKIVPLSQSLYFKWAEGLSSRLSPRSIRQLELVNWIDKVHPSDLDSKGCQHIVPNRPTSTCYAFLAHFLTWFGEAPPPYLGGHAGQIGPKWKSVAEIERPFTRLKGIAGEIPFTALQFRLVKAAVPTQLRLELCPRPLSHFKLA